jgi:chorismate synthase
VSQGVVRRLRTIDELTEASDVVAAVTGYRDIHPGVLLSVVSTGGYAAGAYEDGRCVGTLYGLLGLRDGAPYMHSEMVAVLPELEGRGIAQRLKLDQRAFAREHGMELITWTFDPLRGRNANMNIRRLGCEVAGYAPNMYGELPGFSGGWPTDQLMLEWHVGSPRVEAALARNGVDDLFATSEIREITRVGVDAAGHERLDGWSAGLDDDLLLLRVPQDVQALRAIDMELVLQWRTGVREAFQHYLAAGYRVEWFLPERTPSPRNLYVLSRRPVVQGS